MQPCWSTTKAEIGPSWRPGRIHYNLHVKDSNPLWVWELWVAHLQMVVSAPWLWAGCSPGHIPSPGGQRTRRIALGERSSVRCPHPLPRREAGVWLMGCQFRWLMGYQFRRRRTAPGMASEGTRVPGKESLRLVGSLSGQSSIPTWEPSQGSLRATSCVTGKKLKGHAATSIGP